MTSGGTEPIRLLVLSDLHAFDGEPQDSAPSRLAMKGDAGDAKKMFDDAHAALEAVGIQVVDYVLCPGDITDRADASALTRTWDMLNQLADTLSAKLIATAGNHDYASHDESNTDVGSTGEDFPAEIDPKDSLLQLSPPFPLGSDAERQRYFAYSFAVSADGPAVVISYNSCTFHGLSNEKAPEYNHGRVTPHTVERLKDVLNEYEDDPRPRVLVTHHHPIQLPRLDLRERSQIMDSGLLLTALEDTGAWLVIHGHKHRPFLQYAHGGGGSPTILSAASFAANLGGGHFGGALSNQFHLVELLPANESSAFEMGLAGSVRSWSLDMLGNPVWYPAGKRQGFVADCGFGWRASPTQLAPRILEWIKGQPGAIDQAALYEWEPRLRYLAPPDLEQMITIVERRGNLKMTRGETGQVNGIEFQSSSGVEA